MVFGWIKSTWSSVQNALRSTRSALRSRIRALFGRKVDASLIEELEEILFEADLGITVTHHLIKKVHHFLEQNSEATVDSLLAFLEESLFQELKHLDFELHTNKNGPTVILIVGANGSGKTTSIAKLAHIFTQQGKSVLLAAADTFRAAAQEQLAIWADRLQLPIIRANYQQDPASVAFDAITSATAKEMDILLVDTAGRLENKQHLLKELEKVKKSSQKALADSPHEVLLVLDATVGQNGIEQAKSFHRAMGVTGLILTKLDGSAKGGVVVAIQQQLGIPVKFIGVGEGLHDLVPFDPRAFLHSMLFDESSTTEG
jgi:fused signal recognition particle receptor